MRRLGAESLVNFSSEGEMIRRMNALMEKAMQ